MSSPDISPPRNEKHHRPRHTRPSHPGADLSLAQPRHSHSHNTRSKTSPPRPAGREPLRRSSSRLDGARRGTKGGSHPPAAALGPRVKSPIAVEGKGKKAAWMRRWNNGRAFYDTTYLNFNQVYNLVEMLYIAVAMPDGRFGSGANIMTLAASCWLMYRKVLKEWFGNIRTTRFKKSTVTWYIFTMFTVLIAAIRGNKEKHVKAGLGLL